MKSKRTFSREYKLAAVKKMVEQGLSYAEVAKDLGIADGLLRNRRKWSFNRAQARSQMIAAVGIGSVYRRAVEGRTVFREAFLRRKDFEAGVDERTGADASFLDLTADGAAARFAVRAAGSDFFALP